MKQLFIALLLVILGTSSFASGEEPVPAPALQSFKNTFRSAQEVNWTGSKQYYKVDFLFNSQYISGYYTGSGYLLALTKNILSTQLPVILANKLKEKYSQYWISDVVEASNEDKVTYYVTLENADGTILLQSNNTYWSVLRKIRK